MPHLISSTAPGVSRIDLAGNGGCPAPPGPRVFGALRCHGSLQGGRKVKKTETKDLESPPSVETGRRPCRFYGEFHTAGRHRSPPKGGTWTVVYPMAAPDASVLTAPGAAWPIAGAAAVWLPAGSKATFPISAVPGLRLHGGPGRGGPQTACPVASFRGMTFSRYSPKRPAESPKAPSTPHTRGAVPSNATQESAPSASSN